MKQTQTPKLKLMALDADDLTVIAAYCQDGLFKKADMQWLASERRFLITLSRFAWEEAAQGRGFLRKRAYERRRAVLHFDQVQTVQTKGIKPLDEKAVFCLLSIGFHPDESKVAGKVALTLADGCAIQLYVDCLEARLSDLEGRWSTKIRPDHMV